MGIKLSLAVILVLINEVVSGIIYVSPMDRFAHTGVRIVYKTSHFDFYSPELYLSFSIGANEGELFQARTTAHLLNWDTQGQYYYYEQTSGYVFPNYVVGYNVRRTQSTYTGFSRFYYIPSVVKYCELDEYATSRNYKCSTALNGAARSNWSARTVDSSTTEKYISTSTEGSSKVSVLGTVMPILIGSLLALFVIVYLSTKFWQTKQPRSRREARSSRLTRERSFNHPRPSPSGIFAIASAGNDRRGMSNAPPPSYQEALEVETFDNKAYSSHSTTISEEEAASRTKHAKPQDESELPPLYEQLCLKCYVDKDSPLCKHNSSTSSPSDGSQVCSLTTI